MSFALEVKRFNTQALDQLGLSQREILFKLFGAIILDTPVGNPDLWKGKPPSGYVGGTLRNSWRLTRGTPSPTQSKANREGTEAFLAVESVLRTADFSNDYQLTFYNPQPYAERVEFGWSSQAPAGMVRKNVARFEQIVNSV